MKRQYTNLEIAMVSLTVWLLAIIVASYIVTVTQ